MHKIASIWGVFIRWNGTVEWNGGVDYWNGIVECHAHEMLLGQHVVSLDRSHQLLEDDQRYQVRV